MEIEVVPVDHIEVGQRHRGLNESKVAALAESMAAIGLQQPISLWETPDKNAVLVAGRHRHRLTVEFEVSSASKPDTMYGNASLRKVTPVTVVQGGKRGQLPYFPIKDL